MKTLEEAAELFKDYAELCQFEEGPNEYMVDKESFIEALKEFAKMHVTAALKEASEQFDHYSNKNAILNSYLLTNIK
jgi:hypothetical protein